MGKFSCDNGGVNGVREVDSLAAGRHRELPFNALFCQASSGDLRGLVAYRLIFNSLLMLLRYHVGDDVLNDLFSLLWHMPRYRVRNFFAGRWVNLCSILTDERHYRVLD